MGVEPASASRLDARHRSWQGSRPPQHPRDSQGHRREAAAGEGRARPDQRRCFGQGEADVGQGDGRSASARHAEGQRDLPRREARVRADGRYVEGQVRERSCR